MDNDPVISPTIAALLDIMTDADVNVGQSIQAAKALVEYEAAPEVFELAHEFLIGVATDDNQTVRVRLSALEVLRKVQDRRVQPGTSRAALRSGSQRLGTRLARARRRLELMRAGAWPPEGGQWLNETEPVIVSPVETVGLAERLNAALKRT